MITEINTGLCENHFVGNKQKTRIRQQKQVTACMSWNSRNLSANAEKHLKRASCQRKTSRLYD